MSQDALDFWEMGAAMKSSTPLVVLHVFALHRKRPVLNNAFHHQG